MKISIKLAFVILLSTLKFQVLFAQIKKDQIIAQYLFSGNVVDSSIYGNNGSFTGLVCNVCGNTTVTIQNPTFTSDRFNKPNSAYQFNSNYNFISIPNSSSLQISNNFSFSFWLNPNLGVYGSQGSNQYVILAKWGPIGQASYQISLDNTGKPIIFLHDGVQTNSAVAKTAIPFNKWTNVIFSKSRDTVRIYINGKIDTLKTGCFNPLIFDNSLEIGRVYNNIPYYNDNRFFGKVDDIGIYNIPIDSVNAWDIYNQNGYGSVLPLSLIDFFANSIENKINLYWQTQNQINFQKFEIERSVNGIDFNKITNIQSNSNGVYEYSDLNSPISNILYYRLKMIDKDGSFGYSKIIVVNNHLKNDCVLIFPNPIKNKIQFKFLIPNNDDILFNIVSLEGKKIISGIIKNNNSSIQLIDVKSLQRGTYILQLSSKSGNFQKVFYK